MFLQYPAHPTVPHCRLPPACNPRTSLAGCAVTISAQDGGDRAAKIQSAPVSGHESDVSDASEGGQVTATGAGKDPRRVGLGSSETNGWLPVGRQTPAQFLIARHLTRLRPKPVRAMRVRMHLMPPELPMWRAFLVARSSPLDSSARVLSAAAAAAAVGEGGLRGSGEGSHHEWLHGKSAGAGGSWNSERQLVQQLEAAGFGSVTLARPVRLDRQGLKLFHMMLPENLSPASLSAPEAAGRAGNQGRRVSESERGGGTNAAGSVGHSNAIQSGTFTVREAERGLSHYFVWLEVLRLGLPWALVFENDAELSSAAHFKRDFEQAVAEANELISGRGAVEPPDVVFLGGESIVPEAFRKHLSEHIAEEPPLLHGSLGYTLSQEGARKLVQGFRLVDPRDLFWLRDRTLVTWRVLPSPLAFHKYSNLTVPS